VTDSDRYFVSTGVAYCVSENADGEMI